ncbi:PDZ domain-containing protein [Streptomyces coacervatus]|uniref:PDZ domain-containing protein n=1 Tax=Streptomyces coacervatus TaxID=647381 RepID=A0ABP7H7D5_9ACTN|nr:PDZ domain-containing protein [Streptomyces coacervatus]MDF2267587.1 PDZ domain-containing protein [Streptomyces coacervatus]
MEQTALRPKPMPGGEPGGGTEPGTARRPHAVPRRGRRLRAVLFGLFAGTVLVLSGVGLGTVGATVIGMSKLADLQRQAQAPGSPSATAHPSPTTPPTVPPPLAPAVASLGLEVVDAEKAGAQVVGVHVPGPGYTAGLVRGDVLLAFDRTRIDSAADLARAVACARPGAGVTLTVRHRSGGYQQLTALPGVVT